MKTSIYIILSVFLALVFPSCKKETECKSTTASGVIHKQGMTTYQYGTHTLVDDNGKTIYALKSKNSKLNLDNYIDKNVEIKGHKIIGYPVDGGPEYLEVTKVK
jgi:hypothetical protein